jgi:hypothetical protein
MAAYGWPPAPGMSAAPAIPLLDPARPSAPWLVPLVTALALAAVATALPAVEIDAEADRYHERAEQLLRGEIPASPYHPLGLPVLLAGLQALLGDSLWAGRLVSAAAAGWLVHLGGRLAEQLQHGAGPAARWLLAGNAILWSCGTMASSDMLAAALLLAATVRVASGGDPASSRRALGTGLLLGAAVAMRHAAWFAVPILGWWTLQRDRTKATLGRLALGLAIGSLPHWLPHWFAPPTPGIAGWHNLYLRVVCGFDLDCLHQAQAAGTIPGFGAFLWQYGAELLRDGLRAAGDSATTQLAPMLFGLEPSAWLRGWPLLPVLLGLLHPRTRPTGRWLLALGAFSMLAIAATTLPRPRLLLPLLPLLAAGGAAALQLLPHRGLRRLLLASVVGTAAVTGWRQFATRLTHYPEAEVHLAQQLSRLLTTPFGVLTTVPVLDRHVTQRVYGYPGGPLASTEATWSQLRQRLQATGADVFLTGRASHRALHAQLTASPLPADFRRLHQDDRTLAVTLQLPPSPWLANGTVQPDTVRLGARATMRLRLAAGAERSRLVAAGCVWRSPDGTETLLDLPAAADGEFARDLHPDRAGTHWLAPFLLLGDGSVQRWPSLRLDVTGP